ncbi:MAG: hypothetical protein QXN66_06045 [Thermoplasmatales archaeon]
MTPSIIWQDTEEEFSLPVTTDWKEYEFLYEMMKNMALELRSMVNDV